MPIAERCSHVSAKHQSAHCYFEPRNLSQKSAPASSNLTDADITYKCSVTGSKLSSTAFTPTPRSPTAGKADTDPATFLGKTCPKLTKKKLAPSSRSSLKCSLSNSNLRRQKVTIYTQKPARRMEDLSTPRPNLPPWHQQERQSMMYRSA